MFEKLLILFNQAMLFSYLDYQHGLRTKNGIYVQFEKGETIDGLKRVVRIGSHPSQNNLIERLNDHYYGSNHRTSIFRSHVGRALLHQKKNSYWQHWTKKVTSIPAGQFNVKLESAIEEEVTNYIRSNITFCVIPDLDDAKQRSRLEKALIATFAIPENTPSQQWLGHFHPQYRLGDYGLWNVQNIKDPALTQTEFELIHQKLQVQHVA